MCVCVLRIVKTKVTTRIITTAKKCNNREKKKIQTQKQKKMCTLTGSSKATGDENEMKTGAKLPPPPSVCRLWLCLCLGVGVGVNVGVVVVGDTCERYVRCIQQAAAAVAAASACVFLPISKNIWMIFFSCFFLWVFRPHFKLFSRSKTKQQQNARALLHPH